MEVSINEDQRERAIASALALNNAILEKEVEREIKAMTEEARKLAEEKGTLFEEEYQELTRLQIERERLEDGR